MIGSDRRFLVALLSESRTPPPPLLSCRRVLESADASLLLNYDQPCSCNSGVPAFQCCGWCVSREEVGGSSWLPRRGSSGPGGLVLFLLCLSQPSI